MVFECRECESLGLDDFPTAERLQWHGHVPGNPDWSESSRFVAFSLVSSPQCFLGLRQYAVGKVKDPLGYIRKSCLSNFSQRSLFLSLL